MEQFLDFFHRLGLKKVQVNVPRLHVFVTRREEGDYAVVLFDMPEGNEWSKEQCANIEVQLSKKLRTESDRKLSILTFLCTREVEKVRDFYRQNNHTAVIDLLNYRLLLFEGVAKDQLNIYAGIEEILKNQEMKSSASYGNAESYGTAGYEYYPDYKNTSKREKITLMIRKVMNIFRQIGLVNFILIALNVGIFFFLDFSGLYVSAVNKGSLFWYSVVEQHQYYRLLTYMFLHGSIDHLLNNMLILAVIGGILERTIGKLRYSIIYVLSGTIAGLVSIRYNMDKVAIVRSIGASGAIFGVIGAVLLIVLINKGRVGDLSKRQMILFVALSLYSGLKNQGVDNAAHIGGLLAGFILAFLIYRRPKKRGMVS